MCEWLCLIPVVVDAAFIGQRVKHWKSIRHIISVCPVLVGLMLETAAGYFTVVGGDSFTASLFEAEHQVNPLVKVLRHILTLQRRPVLLEKITGIWSGDRQDTGKCGTEGTTPHVDGRALVWIWHLRLAYMHTMNRTLPEAHGGRTTSPTKLPFCFRPKSRLSLFSRKLLSFP